MQKGYTLLETLIVIGIVLILTGGSLAFYNSYTADKELEGEARKIGDVLELSRKKASAGDLSVACDSGKNLVGFQLNVSSTTDYILEHRCCDSAGSCSNTQIANYTIESNSVTITSATGTIRYNILSAGATITGLGNPIVLRSSAASKCINVAVSTAGTVDIGSVYSC